MYSFELLEEAVYLTIVLCMKKKKNVLLRLAGADYY
jgi:hypothetical protein